MPIKKEKSVNEKAIGRKNLKKIAVVAISVLCVCIVFLIVLNTVIIPKHKLKKAISMLNSGEYDSAYALLEEIENSEAINSRFLSTTYSNVVLEMLPSFIRFSIIRGYSTPNA